MLMVNAQYTESAGISQITQQRKNPLSSLYQACSRFEDWYQIRLFLEDVTK